MRRTTLLLMLACAAAAGGCRASGTEEGASGSSTEQALEMQRGSMVRHQLEERDIRDPRVLAAMRKVPRHRFVPEALRDLAYADSPLPIGRGQTISQPYVVAFTAQALRLRADERVLEVGSGSGYAAAVLSLLAADVYGIEIERELYDRSVVTVRALGYPNVHLRWGDGFLGWPEQAPFDAIVLSCAADEVPAPLWEQLAIGGRLVYPRKVAEDVQELVLVTRTAAGPRARSLAPVRFVPMRRLP